MDELDPNDKRLYATEFFDGALKGEELEHFVQTEMASDPVVRACLDDCANLRALVRRAPRPVPPRPTAHYWRQVRGRMVGARGVPGLRMHWLDIGRLVPVRAVAVAAVAVLLAGAWWIGARSGPGIPRVTRAESMQPGLYTSVVPAQGASVVWIEGLDYLPAEFVLQ